MKIEQKIDSALSRLNRAICAMDPIAVFALFSGGHDSFSATFVASQHPRFSGALHINTGFGIEATRDYVRDTCQARGFHLEEYKASDNVRADGTPDPQSYEDLVRKFGFPGPAGHTLMYNRLKERQLARFERTIGANCRGKKKHRVMYVSGCRSQESQRRMANTQEVQIDGRRIWCAPIHDFDKLDTSETLAVAKQPRSPIVDRIHKSGECLCGAFAEPGELAELKFWPETRPMYERIVKLESEVVPIFGRGWGERPIEDTQTIVAAGMLCWGCGNSPTCQQTPR